MFENMLLVIIFAIILLLSAGGVSAQIVIQVGGDASSTGGIYQFIPPFINNVRSGDIVSFQFMPGNHSVTQSSFENPCMPLPGGFDSGWIFIPKDALGSAPTFNITITEHIQSIWFYCKQLAPTPHCVSGMVGAINVLLDIQFEHFMKSAKSFEGTPGQMQGGLVGVGAEASAGIAGIPIGATVYPITSSAASDVPTPTVTGSTQSIPFSQVTSSGSTRGAGVSVSQAPSSVQSAGDETTKAGDMGAANTAQNSIRNSASDNHIFTTSAPSTATAALSQSKPPVGRIVGAALGGLAVITLIVGFVFWFRTSNHELTNDTQKNAETDTASSAGPYVIYPFTLSPSTERPGPLPTKFAVAGTTVLLDAGVSTQNDPPVPVAGSMPMETERGSNHHRQEQLHRERQHVNTELSALNGLQNNQQLLAEQLVLLQTQISHLRGEQQEQNMELPPLYDNPPAH